ncbi:Flp family type IVb pilin [Phenylobacterium sp.]|uniref:Flp family type IVb pilin n=1 Tax=Phenylobacterium sp. TaxID=1871053 RepID=UPI00344004AB
MGEAEQAERLSHAAGRRAPGGLASRPGLTSLSRNESGATAVEHAVMAAVLGLVVITAAGALRSQIYDVLIKVSDALG